MEVEVRLFATLRDVLPKDDRGITSLDLPGGATVTSVMDRLGVSRDQPLIFLINGQRRPEETILKEGDRVGIFPPLGGG